MNKENLKELIKTIKKTKSFSMHAQNWSDFRRVGGYSDSKYLKGREKFSCGTPACIFGHIKSLGGESIKDWLGLSQTESDKLYAPCSIHANYLAKPYGKGYIGKQRALRVLNHLLETGEVEWKESRRLRQD